MEKILSIDIGGTNIKTAVLGSDGKLLTEYTKMPTPQKATPENVLAVIRTLTKSWAYDLVSCGFPGNVKHGVVYTAPNLGTDFWKEVNLQEMLAGQLGKPARAINDADMLGLGIVEGKGFEMVVTLGTGFGTSFFEDGRLLPHLEIAHHPIRKEKDYDQYIGQKAYDSDGKKKWNEHLQYILGILKTVFNYDTLYIGGGNARKISFALDKDIKIVTNLEGIDGGIKLWKDYNPQKK